MEVLKALWLGGLCILAACLVLPIVGFILVLVYAAIYRYLPLILVAFVIWAWMKISSKTSEAVVPKTAKPIKPKKQRKPRMVKYHGKEIPLSVFIIGMVFAVIVAFVIVTVVVFSIVVLSGMLFIHFSL